MQRGVEERRRQDKMQREGLVALADMASMMVGFFRTPWGSANRTLHPVRFREHEADIAVLETRLRVAKDSRNWRRPGHRPHATRLEAYRIIKRAAP